MISWNMRTEGLELKDGSTIKNYHYEFNSTDKVIAKIVEDVFKAIMDISADRKTEPSNSEKPNNCEELNAYRKCVESRSFWDNKHCDGCYFDERCPFDEPMKTTDYCDICKRDMCEICVADATNPYCVPSHYEINYEPKDEPQTERSSE